jgi:hypothetical protein
MSPLPPPSYPLVCLGTQQQRHSLTAACPYLLRTVASVTATPKKPKTQEEADEDEDEEDAVVEPPTAPLRPKGICFGDEPAKKEER